MLLLDFINGILGLCGEQPLATTTGTLGILAKSIAQTSINSIAQTVRPQAFESFLSLATTNSSYDTAVGVIPDNVIQIYNVFWQQGTVAPYGYARLDTQPFETLDMRVGYAIIGNNLYVSSLVGRGIDLTLTLRIQCLLAPILPTADDSSIGIPTLLIPAIQHMAASILLLSYVDDANAAAQHQRLAEQMINMLRVQVGVGRGRQFNLGDKVGM